MSWIDKILPTGVRRDESAKRASVPEGLWKKCVKCDAVLYRPDVERNFDVCPKCDHHMRIGARRRLDIFLDESSMEEILTDIEPVDRLKFKDKKRYRDRLAGAQRVFQHALDAVLEFFLEGLLENELIGRERAFLGPLFTAGQQFAIAVHDGDIIKS